MLGATIGKRIYQGVTGRIRVKEWIRRNSIERYVRSNHINAHGLPIFEGPGVWPDLIIDGEFSLGSQVIFRSVTHRSSFWVQRGASLVVGDGCFFNEGVGLCATTHIEIGAHCLIGDRVSIIDSTFHDVSPAKPKKKAPIAIGRNVWIGMGCIILPGVTIGDHAVIAAGSIVTKSISARSVAAGLPAKIVDTLDCPDDWIRR
jgi:acetyltransferase-like isoleucine patch superfamily enzyme